MILCEKPLAMNTAEGKEMVAAVEKAGVANMVWYNYRRVPAVTLAKQLIDEGRLGRIFHYRANFLQDWTISADLPQGGTGLVAAGCAARRQRRDGRPAGPLHRHRHLAQRRDHQGHRHDRDLHQGAQHNLNRARWSRSGSTTPAPSWPASTTGRWHVRIDPLRPRTQGAVHVRDQRRTRLDRLGPARPAPAGVLRSPRRVARPRLAIDPRHRRRHPYMSHWWVPGLQIGYEHTFVHQVADFLAKLAGKKPTSPTFRDALETQKVCDAVLASAKSGQWVNVK